MDVRDGDAIAAFQHGDFEHAQKLAAEQLSTEPQNPALLHLMGLMRSRRLGERNCGA